jgi:hypothetical protein
MTREATNNQVSLRRVLLVDAGASGTMGIALLLAAGPAAHVLGLPVGLLRWVGVILVPFAAVLAWVATRARMPQHVVRTIVVANALWVLGSVLLLASGSVAPTRLGELFVLLQAVAVAGFAYLEYNGLGRAHGHAGAGAHYGEELRR